MIIIIRSINTTIVCFDFQLLWMQAVNAALF